MGENTGAVVTDRKILGDVPPQELIPELGIEVEDESEEGGGREPEPNDELNAQEYLNFLNENQDEDDELEDVELEDDTPKKIVDWEEEFLGVLKLAVPKGDEQLLEKIKATRTTKNLSKKTKKNVVGILKDGFYDEDGNNVSKNIGDAYERLITPATAKPMERSKFFFDKLYTAQNPYEKPLGDDDEPMLSGMEATDLMLARGREILALGGSYKDVEDLLQKTGVPRDWWPAELLEEQQAWRKTTASLQHQELEKQFEEKQKKQDKSISIKDLTSVVETVGSDAPEVMSSILDALKKNDALAEAIGNQLGVISNLVGGSVNLANLFQSIPIGSGDGVEKTKSSEVNEGVDTGIEIVSQIGGALSNILDVVKESGSLGEEALKMFTDKVLPGIALANCGIDLIKTGKALVQHKVAKGEARDLQQLAKEQQGRGDRRDGGALSNTMSNEKGAMSKQLAKDGVKLFTKLLEGTGELASLLGGAHGAVAKAGLTITATTISLGSSAVFTGIDWNQARKAKEMLEEARAGNPVARVQIFKESNLYAKAYLVTLAKDGDSLAVQYIVNKGIDEKALSNKALSEKILTEALLKMSGQVNDQEVPDSLFEAMTGGLKEMYDGLKQKVKLSRSGNYDESWTASDDPVDAKSWKKNKQGAIEAGLLDVETGIGEALSSGEKPISAALQAAAQGGMKRLPDTQEGKKYRDLLLAGRAALGNVEDRLMRYTPMTAPLAKDRKTKDENGTPLPHKGMVLYVASLLDRTRVIGGDLDKELVRSGLMNPQWGPTQQPGLDAGSFTAAWQEGTVFACLPTDDSGAAQKLGGLAAAWNQFQQAKAGRDGTATRKAALAVTDAVKELSDALEGCRIAAGAVPKMQEYLFATLELALEQQREAQDSIDPSAFTLRASVPLIAAGWTAEYERAIREGFAGTKDKYADVATAMEELDSLAKTLPNEKDGAKRLQLAKQHALAINTLETKLGVVADAVPALTAAVRDVIEAARVLQAGLKEGRGKVDFTVTAGATGKGWEDTYEAAVAAGAVPPAPKPMGGLKSALETATKQVATFADTWKQNPKPWALARKPAAVALEAVEAAIRAAHVMAHWPEYDVPKISGYLEKEIVAPLHKLIGKGSDIQAARAGNPLTLISAKFEPTPANFNDTVAIAVKNGLVDNPSSGEFKAGDYLGLLNQRLDNINDPTQWDVLRNDALKDAELLTRQFLAVVQRLDGQTENVGFKKYLGEARKLVLNVRKLLVQRLASRAKQQQQPPSGGTGQQPPQQDQGTKHTD